ncbi:hypothetical protein MP638_006116, partial [Amoeboaphelidium occidentale]
MKRLLSILLLAIIVFPLATTLDHDKSFLIQEDTAKVLAMALYQDSLLLTLSADIVQKNIETGLVERTFRAHTNKIISVIVVNGSLMVTAGSDSYVILWDLESGSIIRRIRLGPGDVRVTCMSLFSTHAVVGSMDSKVRQVNLATGSTVKEFDVTYPVLSVAVDENFFFVSTTVYPDISKIRISTRGVLMILGLHTELVYGLLLDNNRLFSASLDKTVICWNANNGRALMIYEGHKDAVLSLLVQDDVLYSAGRERIIIKWNIENGLILKTFPDYHAGYIRCFAHKDTVLFSGAEDASAIMWNSSTGEQLKKYSGRDKQLNSIVLWKNYILSGGGDSNINAWDSKKDATSPTFVIVGYQQPVNSILIYEDFLFSGDSESLIRQWNLTILSPLNILTGHESTVNSLTANDRDLFSADSSGFIFQWSLRSLNNIVYFKAHSTYISAVQFHEEFLYSGSLDLFAKRWGVSTLQPIQTYFAVQFHEEFLYSGSLDLFAKRWGVSISQPIQTYFAGQEITTIYVNGNLIIVGSYASLKEPFGCYCIISLNNRVFSGHEDSSIRVRDINTLGILETYNGHRDFVRSLIVDSSGVLYSASNDGSIKKWNMLYRKVSYSFENSNGSVSSIVATGNLLLVGTRGGVIPTFHTSNGSVLSSLIIHQAEVTSIITDNDFIYSCGMDGKIMKMSATHLKFMDVTVFRNESARLISMTIFSNNLFTLGEEIQIHFFDLSDDEKKPTTFVLPVPANCIAVNEWFIFVGTKFGVVSVFNSSSFRLSFELKKHTSQIKDLLLEGQAIYSASTDKTIVKWSWAERMLERELKRELLGSLGHVGPVNALSLCNNVLFSAGSDLSVRRWDSLTGKHQDVFFGFSRSVTTILCYNNTVFAGSEDFSVLMFLPEFELRRTEQSTTFERTISSRNTKKTKFIRKGDTKASGEQSTQALLYGAIIAVFFLLFIGAVGFKFIGRRVGYRHTPIGKTITGSTIDTITDIETIINTVMGISKHAAFLIDGSLIAKIKPLAKGGGGEIFLCKIIDSAKSKQFGDTFVQKVIFIKNKNLEEAFYQEVGIMIMLNTFPHFCKIIGFTENPLSMILKYYTDGSLYHFLRSRNLLKISTVKVLKEI